MFHKSQVKVVDYQSSLLVHAGFSENMKKSKSNLSLKGHKKITFSASHKRKYITSFLS